MNPNLTDPEDIAARHDGADALNALYDGEHLRACDVPRRAWSHLLRVITTPQTPPRSAAVQARMDALAADIEKESIP